MVAGVCNLATVTLPWHLLLVFSTDQQALILSLVFNATKTQLRLGVVRDSKSKQHQSFQAQLKDINIQYAENSSLAYDISIKKLA